MLIDYRVESLIDELFLDKAHLFLIVLNHRWQGARGEAEHLARLLRRYKIKPGDRILDLGCGNGRIAINLAMMGYRVTGLDYSNLFIEDAVEKSRKYNVYDKVEFIHGNAFDIDKIFNREKFKLVFMYWTTLIGYSLDPAKDLELLKKIHGIVEEGGYFMLLNHASIESLDYRALEEGVSHYKDLDEYALISKATYEPARSILHISWRFYRKMNEDLMFIGEVSYDIKIYSMHEIVEMSEKAGWKLIDAYCSIKTMEPYKPGRCSLNIVFTK